MPPATERLRATVEHLAAMERGSASEGERRAAEWIRDRLSDHGLRARVEEAPAVGSFHLPLALLSAAGLLAGAAGRLGLPIGALASAGIVDDVSGGPHAFRTVLPHRTTYNVVAEAGDPEAARTLVFVSHHDAAHGGFIFRPELMTLAADRFPEWYARQHTSPQVMRLVAAGPLLAGLGAALRRPWLRGLGLAISAGSLAAFLDIAARGVVPGANDNLSAVAVVLELARALEEQPVRGVRVLLVSTGSEESFMEGMRGFVARHRAELAPERTQVICLESLGSPELVLLEGEGMIRMNEYDAGTRDLLAEAAQRAGVPLRRGLRSGLATDALIAHGAGYPTATLASVNEYKLASNYHSPNDIAANVDYGTVAAAARVAEAAVRAVAERAARTSTAAG